MLRSRASEDPGASGAAGPGPTRSRHDRRPRPAARRDPHLLAEIIAVWAPGDDPAPHRAWAERTSAALAPHALPGGYPNLLAPEETDRVRLAYGPNWARLRRAKRRYDPRGTFSAVPTLPPATPPTPRVPAADAGAGVPPVDLRERSAEG